MGEVSVW